MYRRKAFHKAILFYAVVCVAAAMAAQSENQPAQLVTGKRITLPALGAQAEVGSMPMSLVLSPDGKYAVVSDMGFHQWLSAVSTETGKVVSQVEFPSVKGQRKNGLYYGLAFAGDGTLYAAQGANDSIAKLRLGSDGRLEKTGAIAAKNRDFPAGVAVDGKGTLYVANNDPATFAKASSVAIYRDGVEVGRYTFRESFGGTPNFPLAIAALRSGKKAYVASQRDGAVYVLDTSEAARPRLLRKIATGAHPVALAMNGNESLLYVANADSDTVSVVSVAKDRVVSTLLVRPGRLAEVAGASPVGLGLSPDGTTLYAALGDMNALAVAAVKGKELELRGYIPTGWYPSAVAASRDGKRLLFLNAKGTTTRHPNPGYRHGDDAQYGLDLIRGSVSLLAVPGARELARYTREALENNGVNEAASAAGKDAFDHSLDWLGVKSGKIKHVIYVVKENRSYDQVLGDLPQGNGDARLAMFGKEITPNLHALPERFVLLDNFYVTGEVSGDGWPWSTGTMANEYVIKNVPYNYSGRGREYDFEGQNNGYLVGGHPAKDPDGKVMSVRFPKGAPAIPDVAEAPGGHIWDAVRAAGLSYRNYGFFYSFGEMGKDGPIIPDNYPGATGLQPAGRDLAGTSDWDYRRFDNDYADSNAPGEYGCAYEMAEYGHHREPSRFAEWMREFRMMLAKDPTGGAVPAFMTVRLPHDHTQGFAPGKFAPTAEVADNDYAVGQLVEAVSRSPIWKSTAIFILEDDAQDGPDHVDSHRSIAFVISPWMRRGTVDHAFYNTDSVLKTMEMLLGVGPLTQYDAVARPIAGWSGSAGNGGAYEAIRPAREVICRMNPRVESLRRSDPMRELVARSAKMNFERPDSAPAAELNEILWKGIKGTAAPKVKKGLGGEEE